MAFTLGEYQDIFLEEADDQIQELNKNLLEMEQNPEDENIINNIFRAAHSLKSSAAFVGLNDLSDLAHKMENLLQGVRDKTFTIDHGIIDVLFQCFDYINAIIESISQGEEPHEDLSGIIAKVLRVHQNAKDGISPAVEAPAVAAGKKAAAEMKSLSRATFSVAEKKTLKKGLDSGFDCYEISIYIDKDAQMKWIKAQLVLNNLKNLGEVIQTVPGEDNITDESIGDVFKIVVLTKDVLNNVFKACDVDLVVRVDVVKITLVQKDNKYVLAYQSKGSSVDQSATVEQKPSVAEEKPVVRSAVPVSPAKEEEHDFDDRRESDRRKRGTSLKTVKVSVDKLDELLNNVGELVIANSGFFRLYEDLKKQNTDKNITNEFKNRMEQMSRIAKDLQSGIMKTRMVPIGQVFDRFNRLVRDLAKETNKNVQLVTKGEDTELDKKVIDVIGEPLMHMIRNSIDHGIENYEQRITLKKPEIATVTLNAYQGGNQIYVEVIDDGRGLNIDAIKKKAVERGLATAEAISNMDVGDIYEFIFHPGFSTADKITDVSGRGVGMNVVKEVVNEMNGTVTIESEYGMGTRFIMAFPLTLAIIPAIMVNVTDETYAIPLSDVIETIKISHNDITTIEGHEVINLRGEILSLLRLYDFVGTSSNLTDMENIPVVVVGYNNRKIGLIVDELEGKLEIVIKSLDQNYVNVEGLAGASILGDGSICLILDISSMINRVINEQEKLSREDKKNILQRREASIASIEQSQSKITEVQIDRMTEKKAELNSNFVSLNDIKNDDSSFGATASAAVKKPEIFKGVKIFETELPSPEKTSPKPKPEAVKTQPSFSDIPKIASISEISKLSETSLAGAFSSAEKTADERYQGQTSPVMEATEVAADEKVKEALNEFRQELHQNVAEALSTGELDDHIKKSLNIGPDDMKKVQLLANVGIMQGAESLSSMIGKRVDIAIPEVRMLPVEKIPTSLGLIDDVYVGVYMSLEGDMKGTVLLSMPDDSSYSIVDDLYGFDTGITKELNDDAASALKEITNIVGSAVVNAFSEKTGLSIMPTVPIMVHDYMQSILDSILVLHNLKNDYALIMDTVFYYADDRIMANLLILPDTESLKYLLGNLRNE